MPGCFDIGVEIFLRCFAGTSAVAGVIVRKQINVEMVDESTVESSEPKIDLNITINNR